MFRFPRKLFFIFESKFSLKFVFFYILRVEVSIKFPGVEWMGPGRRFAGVGGWGIRILAWGWG